MFAASSVWEKVEDIVLPGGAQVLSATTYEECLGTCIQDASCVAASWKASEECYLHTELATYSAETGSSLNSVIDRTGTDLCTG